ncbi:uncharacterized protein Aud_006815 [Aspergillus udagawae]|uniref:Uncharacterized protein n=1 Tax=Aspergillus udagawae TaxID=91492 RepID=A0A8E0QWQ2_9EURO|nr:uncharacterized protein Aud_006815 [Aspergillus udagawae]GIC90381.1 hypothetical protein Aud_006815 [Aspergillus udagawae]
MHQWMTEFSSIPTCQDYLQKYLRQLCLCAFRKDVFTQIKALLKPESATAALAGNHPALLAQSGRRAPGAIPATPHHFGEPDGRQAY